MQLIKKILSRINGLHYPQEYLCIGKETFAPTLQVYLVKDRIICKNVTDSHLFVGYNPLVFLLYFPVSATPEGMDHIDLVFSERILVLNEKLSAKDALAVLSFKILRKQVEKDITLLFYEGIYGAHQFISSFHQTILRLNNRLYNKKPGNVYLPGNLFTQVQIAYSLPRNISLVTVGSSGLYNVFPTDLHGAVNEQYYVSSLRTGGKACSQVQSIGRLAISTIDLAAYKKVYSLGKNHMQDLKPADQLSLTGQLSSRFKLPLPAETLVVRELEVLGSFSHGIHQFFLYRVVSNQGLSEAPSTLSHIHAVYATWRDNKGLAGNYLMR